jgi:hypothetical protein
MACALALIFTLSEQPSAAPSAAHAASLHAGEAALLEM